MPLLQTQRQRKPAFLFTYDQVPMISLKAPNKSLSTQSNRWGLELTIFEQKLWQWVFDLQVRFEKHRYRIDRSLSLLLQSKYCGWKGRNTELRGVANRFISISPLYAFSHSIRLVILCSNRQMLWKQIDV